MPPHSLFNLIIYPALYYHWLHCWLCSTVQQTHIWHAIVVNANKKVRKLFDIIFQNYNKRKRKVIVCDFMFWGDRVLKYSHKECALSLLCPLRPLHSCPVPTKLLIIICSIIIISSQLSLNEFSLAFIWWQRDVWYANIIQMRIYIIVKCTSLLNYNKQYLIWVFQCFWIVLRSHARTAILITSLQFILTLRS